LVQLDTFGRDFLPGVVHTDRSCFHKPIIVTGGGVGVMLYYGAIETKVNWRGWIDPPAAERIDARELQTARDLHAQFLDRLDRGSLAEVQAIDKAYIDLTLNRLKLRPAQTIANWVLKIPRLWYHNYIPMYRDKEASGGFFIFYFALAVFGFCYASAESRLAMAPIWLLFLYLTVIFMPLHIEPRYGVALMPAIIGLSGAGLFRGANWINKRIFSIL
jgi:hypothetical protein